MKPKLSKPVINKVYSLIKQIVNTQDKETQAYLTIKLYVLLTSIQNNYTFSDSYKRKFNKLFITSVDRLTTYFNCTPYTLPSHLISTVGKEVEPYFVAADKVAPRLLLLKRNEAEYFKAIIDDGKIRYQTADKANSFSMDFSDEDREFVLSFSGDLYVFDETRKEDVSQERHIKHTSFLSGNEVLAAGMIKIKNNQIVEISNDSGHYRPSHKDIALIVNHLDMLGIDISTINLNLMNPTLIVRADVFLTNYPELQRVSNRSYQSYEDIRKKAWHIAESQHRCNRPSRELQEQLSIYNRAIATIEQEIEEEFGESKEEHHSLERVQKLKRKITTKCAELWFGFYLNKLESVESTAFLNLASTNRNFDKEIFDEILFQNNLPPLGLRLQVYVSKAIDGEIIAGDARDVSNENIKEQLIALKRYIENKTWQTFFRSRLGFFNNNYPSQVQKILDEINCCLNNDKNPTDTYDNILKIGRNAAQNSDWRRTEDTQMFYEKIGNNQLLHIIDSPKVAFKAGA
jgi:hypothetical protein